MPMTVAQLIEFLKTQRQDVLVIYGLFSEHVATEVDQIELVELGEIRPDGWVHDARPDKPTQTYLKFPGN